MTRPLLIVASRPFWPVSSGHDRMMDQMIRVAVELGYPVHLRVFARKQAEVIVPADVVLESCALIHRPSFPVVAINLVASFFTGACLQECLFRNRSAAREITRLASRTSACAVVLDMLRLGWLANAEHAWPGDCRRIAYLEDLLSDRYLDADESMMGMESGRIVPKPLSWLVALVATRILRLEAGRARVRETQVAGCCDATLLVSPVEAAELARRCPGSVISVFPPAVSARNEVDPTGSLPLRRLLFIGPGGWGPNADALRLLSEATISVDGKPVCVDWVGLPGPITSLPGILSLGRIGDLDTVLTGQTVLVAPLRSGTGISTKILEAMGRGVPVVATSTALRGIADPDGPVATICDPCPSSITAAVRAVLSDPEKARVVAARALRRTRLVFSRENAASALKLAVEGAQVGRPQSPEQMTARAA